MKNTAKIIELKAENVKRIKAVNITAPDENVIMITGKNAAGKTSVLDCIIMAIGGKDCIPKNPIRRGATSARITLNCCEFIVERHWTDPDDLSKTYLKVTAGEGMQFSSPQKMLDQWIGSLSFDPLAFLEMNDTAQAYTLANLIDFDIEEWQNQREEIYNERTSVNRELKNQTTQFDAMPEPEPNLPKEEISIADLANRLDEEERIITDNGILRAQLKALKNKSADCQNEIDLLVEQIEEFKKEKAEADKAIEERQKAVDALKDPDIESTKQQLKSAESININVRNAAKYSALMLDCSKLQTRSNQLTERLTAHDQAKDEIIKASEMPIPGLSFTDEGVFYNDIPFDQISSSEQLIVSMSIAMALNPKLKVIRITDGSLLDSESMGIIEQMARENDYQIWIEAVDETGQVGIVIEEGEVAINNYEGSQA